MDKKNRHIRKVAILGSGVMGSQLALHFANTGHLVELIDIVPDPMPDGETDRDIIARSSLKRAMKLSPNPVYHPSFATRIRTGNFEDHMDRLADCDWVLEAVIENLDIKNKVFEQVEQYRKKGTLVSSNTSGIPIHEMTAGRSDDFKAHFCGTHFFNPPRYLQLLEIIPSPNTSSEIVDFLMDYGDRILGKTTVLAKDTPAFIANRIGVFSIMAIFHLMQKLDLTIEEVDLITGPATGRPKSATFRTSDVVGIDTLAKVAGNTYDACPEDEARHYMKLPPFISQMIKNKWLGEKTGQGFYKKTKDEKGKTQILALDLKTMEYKPASKPRFPSMDAAKPIDDLHTRYKSILAGKDKAAEFLRQLTFMLLQYSSLRIPEISDDVYQIDDALKAGFGWEAGPFETWEALGISNTNEQMEAAGFAAASWVKEMQAKGIDSFYTSEKGQRKYYNISSGEFKPVPGKDAWLKLDNFRNNQPVYSNKGCTLHNIGDDVLCLEFHTKMNNIGSEILHGINVAIDQASSSYAGLVIGNDAPNFSAGANIALMLMLAIDQEFDELDLAIRQFQNTVMKIRYSPVPVILAPHGLTLGGGCEMSMHADAVVAAAETYIGLVEVGAGLIPGGGGTKEMVLRASDTFTNEDPQIPDLQKRFISIATAKVATSGEEAFDLGVFQKGKDRIVTNTSRVIGEAKATVLRMSVAGYVQPIPRKDITVLGRTALGTFYAGTEAFLLGNYATAYDRHIANKLAWVMCGGDLSGAQEVTEQYLLDLEREAFLSLLGERKTQERMQHILKTGKPLRN